MNTHYEIIVGNNTEQTVLLYSLFNHYPAQTWAGMISQLTPNDIRLGSNTWRGVVRDWDAKVSELHQLIDDLNAWIPEKIEGKWDSNDEHESLNRLHIHFPELERTETDPIRGSQLSRYNDLIHEMQSLYNVRKSGKEYMQVLISSENKDLAKHTDIPNNDFSLFEHKFSFGDLVLHYCHVGRHPWELFLSKDVNCPPEQIIPQRSIFTYHSLRFFDVSINKDNFDKFYHESGLIWPYELSDPRLALGYIKMGKLISVNGKEIQREDTYNRVRNSNRIVSWKIY